MGTIESLAQLCHDLGIRFLFGVCSGQPIENLRYVGKSLKLIDSLLEESS
jgi:hypothetical protein